MSFVLPLLYAYPFGSFGDVRMLFFVFQTLLGNFKMETRGEGMKGIGCKCFDGVLQREGC